MEENGVVGSTAGISTLKIVGDGVTATAAGGTATITFQQQTGPTGATGLTGATGATGLTGATGSSANASITNNTNNYVVTATGDAGTPFNGESNLTFDGTNLTCAGTITANSDENLKTNIKTIENALTKVLKLRGVEFDYKTNGVHSLGFIAQEVENVIPDLVFGNDPKSVAYQNFVALIVEAIKEQQKEIDKLKENSYK